MKEEKIEELDVLKVSLDSNMIIEASAGTGKTYSLEQLFVRYIVEKGYDISEILVVTFTEKASVELKTRIRNILRKKISEKIGKDETVNKKGAVYLRNAFSSFSDAQIYTIHGFCNYCIRNFPFESNSPFKINIIDSSDLYWEAVMDYFRTATAEELNQHYFDFRGKYNSFDDAADFFVSLLKNPYIFRENKLIPTDEDARCAAEEAALFISSKGKIYKAITQLKRCDSSFAVVEKISKTLKLGMRSSSFEKISSGILNIVSSKTLGEIFGWIDEISSYLEKITKLAIDEKGKDISLLAADDVALDLISSVSNFYDAIKIFADQENPNKFLYIETSAFIFIKKAYGKIAEIVAEKKNHSSAFDFDDLIETVRNGVLPVDGKLSLLTKELRRKYKVVLIDEFQDTDKPQWEIFSSIFLNENHKIVLIGDPKQSIYRFRGADLEIYFSAGKELPNCSYYRLGTCYRSPINVVNGINTIFGALFSFVAGGGHNIVYTDVKSGRESTTETAGIEILAIDDSDEEVGTLLSVSKQAVLPLIENIYADEIVSLIGSGIAPSSICILTEKNDDALSVFSLLKKRNIPVILEGDENVFFTKEASAITDLFFALASPGNQAVIKKALFSDMFLFSAEDIIELDEDEKIETIISIFAEWQKEVSRGKLYKVFDEIFYRENPFSKFISEKTVLAYHEKGCSSPKEPYLVRKLKESGGDGKSAAVRQIAEILIVRNINDNEDAYSLLHYMILTVSGDLSDSREEKDKQKVRLPGEPDCVKVMTIHKSKGLEFPFVFFMAGLGKIEGRSGDNYYEYIKDGERFIDFTKKDTSKEKQKAEIWEEKKRLYYVGMTRAREKLYLPAAKNLPVQGLASIYFGLFFDKLKERLSEHNITATIPLNLGSTSLPKGLKVGTASLIVSKNIFELLEEFCSENSKNYLFHRVKVIGASLPVAEETENLSAFTADYDREAALSGFNIYSYSSIVKKSEHGTAVHQNNITRFENLSRDREEDEPDEAGQVDIYLSAEKQVSEFPFTKIIKGVKASDFGNIMHKVLEIADYKEILNYIDESSAAADKKLIAFAISCAKEYVTSDIAENCASSVVTLLYRTLNSFIATPWGEQIKIGEIPPEDRLHELEFMIKIKDGNFDVSTMSTNMDNITLEGGFLKGFIDLVFRINNVYYIADWKTNYLGNELSDYLSVNLERAMIKNNYMLQMKIYEVALDVILNSGKESNGEKQGGCFYFFLRGMGSGNSDGIYFSPADSRETEDFKELFISPALQKDVL